MNKTQLIKEILKLEDAMSICSLAKEEEKETFAEFKTVMKFDPSAENRENILQAAKYILADMVLKEGILEREERTDKLLTAQLIKRIKAGDKMSQHKPTTTKKSGNGTQKK